VRDIWTSRCHGKVEKLVGRLGFWKLFFRRIQAFEFNDLRWMPAVWRTSVTDAIAFLSRLFKSYHPAVPYLREALVRCGTYSIVDLCSGSGGTIEDTWAALRKETGREIHVTLTDKFPCPEVLSRLVERSGGAIRAEAAPVDATDIPARLKGFRTLFTAFHHFPPEEARKILADAVRNGQCIGVFEYTDRNVLHWVLPTLITPVTILLITPFLRPFSFGRFLWTYAIPVIPLITAWDCIISGLRTYLPQELLAMAREVDGGESYVWMAERIRGGSLTYLIGTPKR
jgi:hypothetical protein